MPKMPDILPVIDLRQDAAGTLKRVRVSKRPVVITQRGRATAVMRSFVAYILRQNPAAAWRFKQRAETVLRKLE